MIYVLIAMTLLQTFAWLPLLVDLSLQSSGWELQLAIAAGLVQAVITVMAWLAVIGSSEDIAKQLEDIAPRTAQEEGGPQLNVMLRFTAPVGASANLCSNIMCRVFGQLTLHRAVLLDTLCVFL